MPLAGASPAASSWTGSRRGILGQEDWGAVRLRTWSSLCLIPLGTYPRIARPPK